MWCSEVLAWSYTGTLETSNSLKPIEFQCLEKVITVEEVKNGKPVRRTLLPETRDEKTLKITPFHRVCIIFYAGMGCPSFARVKAVAMIKQS